MVALLAFNWISVLAFQPSGQPRVRVPFSPYFVQRVQAGAVRSISSQGDTIPGTFAAKIRYPVGDRKAVPTTLFSTEVPAFWSNAQLTALLQTKRVQVNARSSASSTSLLSQILLGFGPTLLIVALFVIIARRAQAGGGAGGLSAFGRSKARRVDPERIPSHV